MSYRLRVEESTYTIQAPIHASSLGRRLGQAGLTEQFHVFLHQFAETLSTGA